MEKIERTSPPAWLKDHEEWGESSLGRPVFRNKLMNELAKMTFHHCSFCDENLMGKKYVILQFRPEIEYPSRGMNGKICSCAVRIVMRQKRLNLMKDS